MWNLLLSCGSVYRDLFRYELTLGVSFVLGQYSFLRYKVYEIKCI